MAALDSFYNLKNFAKGRITKGELMDSEPLISNVDTDFENRGKSLITIEYPNTSSFLKAMNLAEEDAWFVEHIFNPNWSHDMFDFEENDSFLQGYGPWSYFESQTTNTINQIAKYILPGFDITDDRKREELTKKLYNLFPKEIDSIIQDFTNELNNEMETTAKQEIKSDFSFFLMDFDFNFNGFDGFTTSVNNLISLFIQHGVPHLSLGKLIKKIFSDTKNQIGGWNDNRYEFRDDANFDNIYFNREANNIFEKILDKIEDEHNEPQKRKYVEMVERILQKFKINVWYELPKDNKVIFRIKRFIPEKNKVEVEVKHDDERNMLELSEDSFYNFLYQPSLFGKY